MQSKPDIKHKLKLIVNGKEIPANPFVTTVFTNVIMGMIASLKTDENEIQQVRIEIEKSH